MDLIFKRYSSPFIFLDVLIQNNELAKGVSEIWELFNEDKQWEFYLHRMIDKSFNEFKTTLSNNTKKMTSDDFETTLNNSKSILQGFNPLECEVD